MPLPPSSLPRAWGGTGGAARTPSSGMALGQVRAPCGRAGTFSLLPVGKSEHKNRLSERPVPSDKERETAFCTPPPDVLVSLGPSALRPPYLRCYLSLRDPPSVSRGVVSDRGGEMTDNSVSREKERGSEGVRWGEGGS